MIQTSHLGLSGQSIWRYTHWASRIKRSVRTVNTGWLPQSDKSPQPERTSGAQLTRRVHCRADVPSTKLRRQRAVRGKSQRDRKKKRKKKRQLSSVKRGVFLLSPKICAFRVEKRSVPIVLCRPRGTDVLPVGVRRVTNILADAFPCVSEWQVFFFTS